VIAAAGVSTIGVAPPPTRAAIAALVQEDRVHRDLYLSEALFALEQKHFFANTWNYLGHASEVPAAGDYRALEIAGRPLVMVRREDGSVGVLYNRCAHKGTPLVGDSRGNTGRFFRCPYHAWTYRLDGTLRAVPLASGYEGTSMRRCKTGEGMCVPGGVAVHRDFVFVKINPGGPEFASYFGEALAAIDNLVDRSPVGRLQIAGGCLRSLVRCNWKTYLENVNDTVHPLSTHESATAAAAAVWQGRPDDAPKPMALEQILPFAAGHDFFDRMGGRVLPNGHSVLGTRYSIHSGYGALAEYEAALRAAHGDTRAAEILQRSPQNAICYPSLALKGSPQTIRVIRPLAADRTVVEAWSFRVEGAPDLLLERSVTYNRLVFSPMSVVAHDDLHIFQGIQKSLRAEGNDWVSLHRGFDAGELATPTRDVNGTNELLMRNQFRAWVRFMTLGMDD
jgi:phenylpropionate dioxygenase-like ring-hydroxylating dioxygenase large terminal subunit